ncbi:hypothetical protein SDC9_185173 [bioreactor metagenome]|uniref:Uncharacterized protein n=1 Tax=bioreactor metagenome TaxID=1076179 RepID=A0A645HQL5_9ZZZZ
MLPDSPLRLRRGNAQSNAQLGVDLGVHVNGYGAAKDHGIDDTAVNIAGQNNLIPFFAGGEDHALDGGGGAVDHKKSVPGAKSGGSQFFRFLNDGNGMTEVVQRLHGINIQRKAAFPQEIRQFPIALASFVARYVKRHDSHPLKTKQSFVNRGSLLVHSLLLLVAIKIHWCR